MKVPSVLLFAAALVGCGGNVVVDSDVVSSTTTSSTTTTLTCTQVCQAIAEACGAGSDCTTSCSTTDKLGNQFCPDAYQAYLACAFAAPAMQCNGNGCIDEASTVAVCISNACQANPGDCVF